MISVRGAESRLGFGQVRCRAAYVISQCKSIRYAFRAEAPSILKVCVRFRNGYQASDEEKVGIYRMIPKNQRWEA